MYRTKYNHIKYQMLTENIINKYYEGQEDLKKLLLHHSRQVAERAMEVLDAHPEIQADRTFIYESAMLHDIGIFLTNAPGIGCHGIHPYICHGILGAEILRAEGLPRHARVAERHTGTGLTQATIKAQGLPLPAMDYSPESIEEQIVCFADKFFSKSHPERTKTPEQVRNMLLSFPDADTERWDHWISIFG